MAAGGGAEAPRRQGAGRLKGTILVARMRFLRAQDPRARDRVLALLHAADRQVVEGILLPSSWYPRDLVTRLEHAIAEVLARGSRTLAFMEMGRFSAQANLGPGGVQRPYLREGDPHHLLERVPRMYVSQHDSGRREYERLGARAALIRSYDTEAGASDDCHTTVGWLERAVELSGGRQVRVRELQCRTLGAAHCAYRADWS